MANDLRQLQHDLRGSVNILMLCVASLRHADRELQLEFLDNIVKAADKTIALLDVLETMPEHFSAGAEDPQ